jgi:hypothetical protein
VLGERERERAQAVAVDVGGDDLRVGVELGELNGPQRAAVEAVLARPPLALLHGLEALLGDCEQASKEEQP